MISGIELRRDKQGNWILSKPWTCFGLLFLAVSSLVHAQSIVDTIPITAGNPRGVATDLT